MEVESNNTKPEKESLSDYELRVWLVELFARENRVIRSTTSRGKPSLVVRAPDDTLVVITIERCGPTYVRTLGIDEKKRPL